MKAIEKYLEMKENYQNEIDLSNANYHSGSIELAISHLDNANKLLETMNQFYLENQNEIDNDYPNYFGN